MSIDFIRGSLRQSIIATELERLNRINRAWTYYVGEAPKQLATTADADDNVRINLARVLVAKGVSWLFGADRALTFAIKDNEEAEGELEDLWPIESRSLTLNQLAVNGGVAGHTFCRLLDDPIRVLVWDPSNTTAIWDDEDIEHVIEFHNQWTVGIDSDQPEVRRQRVIEQAAQGNWLIIDERSNVSGDSWEEIGREIWPHDWSPVFHCQNIPMPNEFWGQADLETDVMDLIDNIELVGGYTQKIIRHRGHPLPWATGESSKNIESLNISLGQFLAIPSPEAKVGQLEATTPEGALELYQKLWEAFHYVTRTPPISFGIVNMSNVAEETVELAYSPAVEKTWDKRLTYGPMLSELASRILELGGTSDLRPSPNWGNIIPRSATAQAMALEADRRMGIVSKETASEQRGYDWDVESERLAEESKLAAEEQARLFNMGAGTIPGGNGGGPPENIPEPGNRRSRPPAPAE